MQVMERRPSDLSRSTLEQVIQTAHAIPPVAIRLQQYAMPISIDGLTVIVRKKVNQRTSFLLAGTYRKGRLSRQPAQVMYQKDGIVTPLVAHDQYFLSLRRDEGKI